MNFLNQTLDSLEDQIVELRRERNALRAENAGLVDDMNLLRDNNTALRAKIAEMGQQEPIAKVHIHQTGGNAGISWSARPINDFDSLPLLRDLAAVLGPARLRSRGAIWHGADAGGVRRSHGRGVRRGPAGAEE